MDDPFVEAMVLGAACGVAAFVLGLAVAVAVIQLRAWQRRREARRASEEAPPC